MIEPAAHLWPQPADDGAPTAFHVAGWRFIGAEVAYEQTIVVGGRPLMFAALAGCNAMSNRRRRQEAARLAAPRWRPLGEVPVVVAEGRLLVLHEGAWASVWFDAITEVRCPPSGAITLLFENDPPYAFTGGSAGHLASALDHALSDRRVHSAPSDEDSRRSEPEDLPPWLLGGRRTATSNPRATAL